MNKQEVIHLLKKGDRRFFEEQYLLYQQEFLGFAHKRGIATDDAVEIYQQSFIALFENAASGKLTVLTSSLKTYIFGIAKLKMLEYFKKQQKTVNLEEITSINEQQIDPFIEEGLSTEKQNRMQQALLDLGKRCRNLIELFYLQGLSIKEIVQAESYTNENTVKAQKSRCMKQLRELVEKS
ncbi:RNA polymerase sigma factor [Nonlabens xiamenensis]|uniref:RNA polymerase sigma factor n=1 Tax=Nonlabens xiamenensis TaxID=2341043 RepID=UPI000F608AB7|nr:sigma-70 family RNA polymerase sigma factor [Nonlabens xiamenensis]